jgi:hypothetical protein
MDTPGRWKILYGQTEQSGIVDGIQVVTNSTENEDECFSRYAMQGSIQARSGGGGFGAHRVVKLVDCSEDD